LATVFVNLVNFSPVTPVFTNVKAVHTVVSFFKINISDKLSHGTDFHQVFTIWWIFDRRLLI